MSYEIASRPSIQFQCYISPDSFEAGEVFCCETWPEITLMLSRVKNSIRAMSASFVPLRGEHRLFGITDITQNTDIRTELWYLRVGEVSALCWDWLIFMVTRAQRPHYCHSHTWWPLGRDRNMCVYIIQRRTSSFWVQACFFDTRLFFFIVFFFWSLAQHCISSSQHHNLVDVPDALRHSCLLLLLLLLTKHGAQVAAGGAPPSTVVACSTRTHL